MPSPLKGLAEPLQPSLSSFFGEEAMTGPWRTGLSWTRSAQNRLTEAQLFIFLRFFPGRPTPYKCLLALTKKHRLPKKLACSYWFILQTQPTPKPHFTGPQLNEVCSSLNFSFLHILLPNYDHTKGHAPLPVGICSNSPSRWKAQVSWALLFLATYIICKLT